KELPILLAITLLSGYQLLDGNLSRMDGIVLLIVFLGVMAWTILQASGKSSDELTAEIEAEMGGEIMSRARGAIWLVIGLLVLIVSSRILVWGAVSIAEMFGVSEVIIGLTIVAVGTSLPELASALAAVRKGEHDMVIGNVLGSGVFNTLAVVGIAAVIRPFGVEPELLFRDWPVMLGFTLLLLATCIGWRQRQGRINRLEGGFLLATYVVYTGYLVTLVVG
ncbi:MAG: calcium/sodium antiporter, partial [Natronospirillum sp.]